LQTFAAHFILGLAIADLGATHFSSKSTTTGNGKGKDKSKVSMSSANMKNYKKLVMACIVPCIFLLSLDNGVRNMVGSAAEKLVFNENTGQIGINEPKKFYEFQIRGYFGGLLIILLAEMSETFRFFLELPPILFLGKVSFGLYLLHPVICASVSPWIIERVFPGVYLFKLFDAALILTVLYCI
jgi:hypothetical protein